LDVEKVFDTTWHTDLPRDRQAGVPQGSALSPQCTNDTPKHLVSI
jgi:hypothetical protein